jgi:hypothetical protein
MSERGVNHPPHLAVRLKKSRALPPFSRWNFVTCCRVNFTFTLLASFGPTEGCCICRHITGSRTASRLTIVLRIQQNCTCACAAPRRARSCPKRSNDRKIFFWQVGIKQPYNLASVNVWLRLLAQCKSLKSDCRF